MDDAIEDKESDMHVPAMFRVTLLALIGGAVFLVGCSHLSGPVAVATAMPQDGYAPLEVTFDAEGSSSPSGAPLAYTWDFGDETPVTGPTISHTFLGKGPHRVRLTVTDERGRTGNDTVTIRVLNRIPHADFRFSPYGAPRDYPVSFDATLSEDSDGKIVSYSWDFGDGTSATGVHVEHFFSQSHAEYLVTLTVIDDDGAENKSARRITVLGCDTCG
jgi:PKD repeat protein